jgi:hypothetical protein
MLKSWVVENSLDGAAWTEIDRETDNKDFKADSWETLNAGHGTASFAVSKPAECRFIRLTQTGKRHPINDPFFKSCNGDDHLVIRAFEVFGTLLE